MAPTTRRGLLAACMLFALSSGSAEALAQEAPFRVLDNDEGAYVDLVTTAIRPLALHPTTGNLWSVNSHDSTVVEFLPDGTPVRAVHVPWGPVSIGHWSSAGEEDSMLVVCRNSQTLVRLGTQSGEVLSLVRLASEPADLLVHPGTGHAFVSLAGADSVVEVDVAQARIVGRFAIPSERPTFLALDGADVLVAPMLSGNNSTVHRGENFLDAGAGRVLDLEDPTVAIKGLPDHDLFRLTPGGGVTPVARDMGAVLFAVGVHPQTGDVWQLGTEAENKNREMVGEPALRGEFIINQASRAQLVGGAVVAPLAVHNLDDHDPFTPGVQYDPTRSVGQPYALAFGAAGEVYVSGLLTDNVTEYTSSGDFVREWDVGSIPRGLLPTADGSGLFVYLWGSNTVERWDLTPASPQLAATLDLGHDPTPVARRAGRKLFFDASHSMFANASCASCHVETDADLLAWDLSNLPYDDKGPLVTQFMRGIEALVPFHWRGERSDLVVFNGAFDGLLGGPPLDTTPGGEFDLFQEYVFSTLQPANPLEHERRVVANRGTFQRASGQLVKANAVNGQNLFHDFQIIPTIASCADCHTMPTGTNNDVVFDEPLLDFARRTHFAVASFNGMWRKRQRTLQRIQLRDGSFDEVPTIGVGISAAGLKADLLAFINLPAFFATDKQRRDIASFVEQADSGLAPAVHESLLLDSSNTQVAANRLRNYLLGQAQMRNCDVVAFGSVDLGAGPQAVRWFWDRSSLTFRAEDSSITPRSMGFFVAQAVAGTGRNIFLGLPVGMGERFGVDFDADDLYNADELAWGTDPLNPDTDGDGFPDGHEVLNGGDPNDPTVGSSDTQSPTVSNVKLVYVTGRVAKIRFDVDEPTVFNATWTSGNASGSDATTLYEKSHSVLLRNLRTNSKSHNILIDVVDHGGNLTQFTVPGVITLPHVNVPSVALRQASTTEVQDSSGTLNHLVSGKARAKGGSALAGRRLRVNVFVNGVLTQENLLGSISGANGVTTLNVIENGLTPGDLVDVVVMALHNVGANFGGDWSMPDTAPDMRRWTIEYTGTGL